MGCALFTAYPELAARLPHRPLGLFPTALERVRGLAPDSVELWVKREDRAGPLYGGNKVRKLEFLLADPRLRERPRLLTFGGYGSHHVLAVALYGRELGLAVDAVLAPQPATGHARETLRCAAAAGARLFAARGYLDLPWQALRARRAGGPALWVPPGGSSPLGTLGWLSGGLEIAAQVRAGEAPPFDAIYAAMGSCGTVAGLWLGLGQAAAELVAVRAVPAWGASRGRCRRLARRTAALVAPHLYAGHRLPPRPRLRVEGRFLGPGYGHSTFAAEEAVARGRAAGLPLDTTYTGKALAALLSDAQAGRLDGKRVLLLLSLSSSDLGALRAAAPPSLGPRLDRFLQRP